MIKSLNTKRGRNSSRVAGPRDDDRGYHHRGATPLMLSVLVGVQNDLLYPILTRILRETPGPWHHFGLCFFQEKPLKMSAEIHYKEMSFEPTIYFQGVKILGPG